MPIETVPNGMTYYLVAFDAAGNERLEESGKKLSDAVATAVRSEPVTDIFVMSHGWQGDVPAARAQYGRWIEAMAACPADIEKMREARPGFQPLLVGLHWPSLPWGDEGLRGAMASFGEETAQAIERLVDEYATRIADSKASRESLRTIFEAVGRGGGSPALPPEVRAAYEVLHRESGLGSQGLGGPPGADGEPFDPQAVFATTRSAPASFGLFDLDDLLAPLRALSFWKMKDRARQFGERGGFEFLNNLLSASGERDVRFHLMGHSFGCIVVSASLAGLNGGGDLVRPVNSLALVQGALSLWAYCSEIPAVPGRMGYFRAVIRRVKGPIVTTRSAHDTAVGRWYRLAAMAAGQVMFATPDQLPEYGGIGSFGAHGPGLELVDRLMLASDESYGFREGEVCNLDCSAVIREGGGFSGAHSDIARPEVAHMVWEAARG